MTYHSDETSRSVKSRRHRKTLMVCCAVCATLGVLLTGLQLLGNARMQNWEKAGHGHFLRGGRQVILGMQEGDAQMVREGLHNLDRSIALLEEVYTTRETRPEGENVSSVLAQCYEHRANALNYVGRSEEAAQSYESARALRPDIYRRLESLYVPGEPDEPEPPDDTQPQPNSKPVVHPKKSIRVTVHGEGG